MPKEKQQFAGLILSCLVCLHLLHCSKAEQAQTRSAAEEPKSLAESRDHSSRGGEAQLSNTGANTSPTERDSLEHAVASLPAPFGFIHKV
jgi:hypothetical protein